MSRPAVPPSHGPTISAHSLVCSMANRQSAARSKAKQRLLQEGQRIKLDMLAQQRTRLTAELARLTKLCGDMEAAGRKSGELPAPMPVDAPSPVPALVGRGSNVVWGAAGAFDGVQRAHEAQHLPQMCLAGRTCCCAVANICLPVCLFACLPDSHLGYGVFRFLARFKGAQATLSAGFKYSHLGGKQILSGFVPSALTSPSRPKFVELSLVLLPI